MPPIRFPGFGFQVEIERAVTERLPVQWYGVLITLGVVLALLYCMKRAPKMSIKQEQLLDMMFFVLPAAIIASRLYFVAFNWDATTRGAEGFWETLGSVFAVWDGGVAIYGAIFGAVLTAWIFCRVRKIDTLAMFDLGVLGLLIGQAVGRWGNFINQEVYGIETALPWRMGIMQADGAYSYVHPLFLYESLWCILGLIVLHVLSKKRTRNGQVFMMYLVWYGAGRAVFETMRAPSYVLFVGGVNTSLAVAIGMAAIGVIGMLLLLRTPAAVAASVVADSPCDEDSAPCDDEAIAEPVEKDIVSTASQTDASDDDMPQVDVSVNETADEDDVAFIEVDVEEVAAEMAESMPEAHELVDINDLPDVLEIDDNDDSEE
ncbi:MAG: prolipoprotein diacylglyceryl transferase [Oscillospiraceae bacterium]|nr:prolipoprotein diacylglyceryl transferase [Oscillospiraceae bacterium]